MKNIKKPIYSAIIFFLTLWVLTIWYWAFTSLNQVTSGSWLTATAWNTMVTNLDDLNARFQKSGTNLFYTWGNVGIGTTSPQASFHIAANNSKLRLSSASNAIGLNLWVNDPGAWHSYIDSTINDPTYNMYFRMRTLGTPINALSILGNGNVWIGTTAPVNKLDVVWTIQWDYLIIDPEDNILEWWQLSLNWAWSYWPLHIDNYAWNARIHTLWAGKVFDVLGWDWVRATAFINSSDIRLKKDIQNISSWIETINNLRWVTYHWKDKEKDNSLQYWFIAQEVENILPDLVKTDEKWFKSVNYIGVIPILVKSLQEQQDMIEELKKENQEIKETNNKILEELKLINAN